LEKTSKKRGRFNPPLFGTLIKPYNQPGGKKKKKEPKPIAAPKIKFPWGGYFRPNPFPQGNPIILTP